MGKEEVKLVKVLGEIFQIVANGQECEGWGRANVFCVQRRIEAGEAKKKWNGGGER